MSNQSSPRPQQGPFPQNNELNLPGGQCRYILLMPEIKGQRCACVSFTLNKSMPSATCECGHLACYHMRTAEPPHSADKAELEVLRQRVRFLEEQLMRDHENALGSVVARVSQLEELVERSREEASQEIKGTYRNLNRAWHSIGELERRSGVCDERLVRAERHLEAVDAEVCRLGQRQMELVDADISLEGRIENLAGTLEDAQEAPGARNDTESYPQAEATPRIRPVVQDLPGWSPSLSGQPQGSERSNNVTSAPSSLTDPILMPLRTLSTIAPPSTWIVHISLLSSASQPFPFEKDTNAYKRCLSRGLRQMAVINGLDNDSFVSAVSKALESLLKGLPWMPLQARLCGAVPLQGLPVLIELDSAVLSSGGGGFDAELLRTYCTVCDAVGKMESLYVAMQSEAFSWHFLRRCPVCIDGLESRWAHDPLLDPSNPVEDGDGVDRASRPSAGDTMLAFPRLRKRGASEISRSNSFGSATSAATVGGGGKESRAKIPRTCPDGA